MILVVSIISCQSNKNLLVAKGLMLIDIMVVEWAGIIGDCYVALKIKLMILLIVNCII